MPTQTRRRDPKGPWLNGHAWHRPTWHRPTLTRPTLLRLALGAVIAGVLLWAVISASGGLSSAIAQLGRTQPIWLVPALLAEAASYVFFALQLRRLATPPPDLSRPVWMLFALVVYGIGNLMPVSPAEGMAFSVVELRRRGMTARRAGLLFIVAQWTQFWALVLIFALDRLVAGAVGDLSRIDITAIVGGSLLLVAVTVVAVTASRRRSVIERLVGLSRVLPGQRGKSRQEIRATASSWYRDVEQLLGPGHNPWAVIAIATGGWVADAACLWLALTAAHANVGLEVVVLAYAVTAVVAWIPFLPAGLGAIELALPAVLHRFGVPLVVGLAGTLLWRAMSLFLPALVGILAAVALRLEPSAAPPSA